MVAYLSPFQVTETLEWLAILVTVCSRESIGLELDPSDQAIIVS